MFEEEIKVLQGLFWRVWNTIAYDLPAKMYSREEYYEICMDSGWLENHVEGNKKEKKILEFFRSLEYKDQESLIPQICTFEKYEGGSDDEWNKKMREREMKR